MSTLNHGEFNIDIENSGSGTLYLDVAAADCTLVIESVGGAINVSAMPMSRVVDQPLAKLALPANAMSVNVEQPTGKQVSVRELETFERIMPSGEVEKFCLIEEVDTKNRYAVEASFVEQEQEGCSPYGNGQESFQDASDAPSDPTRKKYSHSVIEFHVLSDDPLFNPENYSLSQLLKEAHDGDLVGKTTLPKQVFLSRDQARERLEDFGSSQEFFECPDSCSHCGADQTAQASVRREYVCKDGGDSVFALGHYNDNYFEPDSEPALAGGRFDLLDDSDTCVACGGGV